MQKRWRPCVVLVEEAVPDSEGREGHRDGRGEPEAYPNGGRAASLALVEDDNADCPCGFSVEDFCRKGARPPLNQGNPTGHAAEVAGGAATRRGAWGRP